MNVLVIDEQCLQRIKSFSVQVSYSAPAASRLEAEKALGGEKTLSQLKHLTQTDQKDIP